LLAVAWRNPADSLDVDGNRAINPLDALLVINELNAGRTSLPATKTAGEPYFDVTGDQSIAPLDALLVLNQLNASSVGDGYRHLDEGPGSVVETQITITLGQSAGTRKHRLQLDTQFNPPAATQPFRDLLAVYLVNPLNPAQTLLDRGHAGTSLFTLTTSGAEIRPGVATWDGSVLELDLSSVVGADTGILKVQLLASDAGGDAHAVVRPLDNVVDAGQAPTPPPAGIGEAAAPGGGSEPG
jgi:hypothetical protein